uniref:Uncharacterized protein n=1 Tax=Arundo donax TaxID=35708 RepID=A0A0A9F7C4_ARUDO
MLLRQRGRRRGPRAAAAGGCARGHIKGSKV